MKVESVLEYDPATDEILGPYKYMQVALARGLFKNWKQPVFIGFDQSMKKGIMLSIITNLHEKGINVVAIVSDNCPANIACWKDLEATGFDHPFFCILSQKRVYVIPDAPHLLKLTRNWLIDHGFSIGHKKITSQTLFQIVNDRLNAEMRPVFKISKGHLVMTNQEKQNVSKAAQVLSRTVAISLQRYVSNEAANDLADFIETVYFWFCVSNSYSPLAKEHYEQSFNGNDHQKQALSDMYNLMKNSTVIGKHSLQTFQKSILIQINALQMLFDDMKRRHKVSFLSTYKINQDVLENFFSQLRQRGGVYDHPSPLSCIYRVRIMVLGKSPSIIHNQSGREQRKIIKPDEYLTSTGADVAGSEDQEQINSSENEEFISATVFSEAEINPRLPDVAEMESLNGMSQDKSDTVSTVSSTQLNMTEQESDGLEYIMGYLAMKYQ
uniref:THAP-type domain-containing protein n=1 Tax=Anopheles epiroticus TaxID=199890 RepID=A0A182PVN8_9DIPT